MQNEFNVAVQKVEAACQELDRVVSKMAAEDADGVLEADDDTLSDLATCSAITSRTLVMFLTDVDEEEYAKPTEPAAPKAAPPAPKPPASPVARALT